jgi:hypothetical protein
LNIRLHRRTKYPFSPDHKHCLRCDIPIDADWEKRDERYDCEHVIAVDEPTDLPQGVMVQLIRQLDPELMHHLPDQYSGRIYRVVDNSLGERYKLRSGIIFFFILCMIIHILYTVTNYYLF